MPKRGIAAGLLFLLAPASPASEPAQIVRLERTWIEDDGRRSAPTSAAGLGAVAAFPALGRFPSARVPANDPPVVTSVSATPKRVPVGQPVTFHASAEDPNGDALSYSWDFGDGGAPTAPASTPQASHSFAEPGNYTVLVRVSDGLLEQAQSLVVAVFIPPTVPPPVSSGTIAYDAVRRRVYVVNPDGDTVAAVDGEDLRKIWEAPVGRNPRTLCQAPDGAVWVTCQEEATIVVLDPDSGQTRKVIPLARASRPFGILFSPDAAAAYVTLEATGRLLRIDAAQERVTADLAICPTPRGIAITGDSRRIFVTRFISPADRGEVVEVSSAPFAVVRTIPLEPDPGPDSERSSRGVPNYLQSITITPDGRRAWVPSKKDNTARGLFRDGLPLTFETTVRAIVSQIDLAANTEDLSSRIDINDADMPVSVAFSREGHVAFVALQGSNAVVFRQGYSASNALGSAPEVGRAPQGVVLNPAGTRLFVHNFLSRTVAVYDVSGVIDLTDTVPRRLGEVATQAVEKLPPAVLRGKRIFYNADDRRMNKDGYLSCASCHLEGESDERVFDFTHLGEGLRNTTTLRGRRGTGHGRVHWTANFDEIQDFEHAIRDAFGGLGFMSDAEFHSGSTNQPLGDAKAGKSSELDDLAAYVASLGTVPPSPWRNADGRLTDAAVRGRGHFVSLGCVSCHAGRDFTDSSAGFLHDVGTLKSGSGGRLGGPLTGIDTPTLKGIWKTAPYLHDGSAPTLRDVLTTADPSGRHGNAGSLSPSELDDLLAYLEQIDEGEAERPPSRLFAGRFSTVPGSSAAGAGKLVLLEDGRTALVSLDVSGLSGSVVAVHLHGPGVLLPLPPGSFSDHRLLFSREDIAALEAGRFSIDVHTSGHPDGEIAGALLETPPPPAPVSSASEGGRCGGLGWEAVLILALIRILTGKGGCA